MKIGIVTQLYYPVLGGVTEHVFYTYQELTKMGHEVVIITSNFRRASYDRGAEVIRIGHDVPLPIPMNGSFPEFNIGADIPNKLREICRKRKLDIIHIHNPLTPMLPFIALKAIKGIPKVGTFHTYGRRSTIYYLFRYPLQTFSRELSGRIAVSEAAREFSAKYFPGEYKIISNGVDPKRFNPNTPQIEEFNDGQFNILFVGRMDPRKGLRYLLTAFPLIKEKIKNARLIVVGGGSMKHYYKTIAQFPDKQDIVFVGRVSYDDLPKYYRTADVYCSPATGGESFGIVLLEAMASGTPVVASDIAGYRDVLSDQQEGFLTKNKSPEDLAEKIIRLAKNKNLCHKLSQQGIKTARKYAWPKVTKQIENYYKEVLDKFHKNK